MGTKKAVGGVQSVIQQYGSRASRWINQCAACQQKGYMPEMPQELTRGGTIVRNLQEAFDPLPLNESGFCEICAEALEHTK
ncbi:MAG: hypothetical protein M3Q99_13810 [Acidobacteriota bacterium]|nr:hypothetical protein [Acidobacteriota bacterium]